MLFRRIIAVALLIFIIGAFLSGYGQLAICMIGGLLLVGIIKGRRAPERDPRYIPELGMYDPSTGEYISGEKPPGMF